MPRILRIIEKEMEQDEGAASPEARTPRALERL